MKTYKTFTEGFKDTVKDHLKKWMKEETTLKRKVAAVGIGAAGITALALVNKHLKDKKTKREEHSKMTHHFHDIGGKPDFKERLAHMQKVHDKMRQHIDNGGTYAQARRKWGYHTMGKEK